MVTDLGIKVCGEVTNIERGPNAQIIAVTCKVFSDDECGSTKRKYVGENLIETITHRVRDAQVRELHHSSVAPEELEGFEDLGAAALAS